VQRFGAHPELMPRSIELAERNQLLTEIDAAAIGFSYVCRRCDVWGRVPSGVARRCWACDTADRLERR
jgi:hypothetical protein